MPISYTGINEEDGYFDGKGFRYISVRQKEILLIPRVREHIAGSGAKINFAHALFNLFNGKYTKAL